MQAETTFGLRLPERGNPIDTANEQHPLLVDLGVAQAIGRRIAGVFRPNAIELPGDDSPPASHSLSSFSTVLDLNPVIGIVGIDQEAGQARALPDPFAF